MIETYDYKYHRGETLVDKPYQTIYCATTKFTPKDYVIINILEKNNHVATVSKQILEHSLMNVMQIDETINNLAIITKKREGEPYDKYINQHSVTIDERIHYGFEYLKRLCNYEDLPTAIKYTLVQPNQVLINGDLIVMEEIIEINEDISTKSFKDIVRSISTVLKELITENHIAYDLSPRCKDFIDRMDRGQHHYEHFKDILHDYKRLFVFATIPELEQTTSEEEKTSPIEARPIENPEVPAPVKEHKKADAEVIDIYIGTTPEEEEAAIKRIEEEELAKHEVKEAATPKVEPILEPKEALQPQVEKEEPSLTKRKSTVKDEIKVAPQNDDFFADTTQQTMAFSKELTSKIDEVLDESSHIFEDESLVTPPHEQADLLSDQAFEEYINKTNIADYDLDQLEEETKYMPSLALDDYDEPIDYDEDDEKKTKTSFTFTDTHKKWVRYMAIAATIIFLLWGLISIGMAFTGTGGPPEASFEVTTLENGRLLFKNTSKSFGLGNSLTEYNWVIYHDGEVVSLKQDDQPVESFKTRHITPAKLPPAVYDIELKVKDSNGVWSEPFIKEFDATNP